MNTYNSRGLPYVQQNLLDKNYPKHHRRNHPQKQWGYLVFQPNSYCHSVAFQ